MNYDGGGVVTLDDGDMHWWCGGDMGIL